MAPVSGWTQLRLALKLAVAMAALAVSFLATVTTISSGIANAASAYAANTCSATASATIIGHSRDITKLSVASVGRFRCSGKQTRAVLRVVLQGRVSGHWTQLAAVQATRNMRAGKTYQLRAKLACHSNPHRMSVRSHVELNGLSGLRGMGTSPSLTTFCL